MPQQNSTGWLVTQQKFCFLPVLQTGRPKSRFLLRPLSVACRRHLLPVSSHPLPSVCVSVLISYKDTSQITLATILTTPFNLITSLYTLSPNSHLLRSWGLGPQHRKLGGQNSAPNRPPAKSVATRHVGEPPEIIQYKQGSNSMLYTELVADAGTTKQGEKPTTEE